MRLDSTAILILLAAILLAPPVVADSALLTLNNNPFTRPLKLEAKPTAVVPKQAPREDPVELDLSATMMSATLPMIIADGELLGIGDSIKGLKLVEIMEGAAVFRGANGSVTFSIREDLQ